MPADSGIPQKIEVIARGLLWSQGRILLCRNRKHGHCYLPGGHVEPGEAAVDALIREFQEETGMDVRVGDPLLISEQRFIQRGKPRHEISTVFHVEHSDGEPPESVSSLEQNIEFLWITPNCLGNHRVLPESIVDWLRERTPEERAPLVWRSESSS